MIGHGFIIADGNSFITEETEQDQIFYQFADAPGDVTEASNRKPKNGR